MMKSIHVVSSLKAKGKALDEAAQWAASIGAAYEPRLRRTTTQLREDYGENFLVYTTKGPKLFRPEGTHVFSLNMAELRIQHLRQGQTDHLLEAVGTTRPIRILDCTCGFGADSLVLSFGLPQGSAVTALEASPLMAAVTGWGFTHFIHEKDDVTAALRRITLRQADYRDVLQQLPHGAFDVIYFDPMFEKPVLSSCQFQPVRDVLHKDPLRLTDIQLALQKATQRVVVKGRYFKELQQALPGCTIYGGKYSRVHFAVWEVNHSG